MYKNEKWEVLLLSRLTIDIDHKRKLVVTLFLIHQFMLTCFGFFCSKMLIIRVEVKTFRFRANKRLVSTWYVQGVLALQMI